MSKSWVTETYTNEQLETIKDAIYKIADARWALEALSQSMLADKQYRGQADIGRAAAAIDEYLTGDDGCIHEFLKAL